MRFLLAAIILPAALLAAGCGKCQEPGAAMQKAAEAAVEATPSAATPGYVKGPTWFNLPDHKGGRLDLAAYAGKPVMIKFFTETCPYCRKAAPFVQSIHAEYGGRGLAVVAAAHEREAAPAARFVKDFAITFPVAYDAAATARAYQTRGVPYLFLLDRNHKVHDLWAGYDPSFEKEIRASIEEILKKS
ncbi:MAG: alkyl hydroperoxide reductase [Elusimicrobia bacterium]|nr:MAG: alkyl hydroperoxide reductase [Elusimicrobiota bacterium]KAF0156829.1 MAG: alkyl hydroperoxide reductase [Elusimicrobiota bacterium]